MADTIALMRKRVLDMAIRGELVEQRPDEGTGTELYRDIEQEKDCLMKSGKIKKEKNFPLVPKKEEPFEIPINWQWVRLGSLTAAEDDSFSDGPFGSNLKTIHYTENPEVRIIQLNNVGEGIWKDTGRKYTTYQHAVVLKRYNIKPGDMVIAKMMPAGRTIIVPEIEDRYIVSSDNVKFVPNKKINSTYIMHAVNSSTIRQMIAATSTGTTRVRTSSSKLKNLFLPLPPLAEQNRIVAKIEEIFAIINQIGTKKEEALSIIRNMRQTALQDAIRGMLVDQDETDESANEILKKIEKEKEHLKKEKKVKIEQPLPPVNVHNFDYDIPAGWELTHLNEIAFVTKLAGFEYASDIKPNLAESGIPLFKGKNVQNGRLVYEFESFIPESVSEKLTRSQLNRKCLLTPYVGTIGNIAIFEGDIQAHLGSNVGKIELYNYNDTYILEEYLLYFLRSKTGIKQLRKQIKSTAQESISIKAIRECLIPLPPLAEQERIVAKLDEIMAICDQMEAIFDGSADMVAERIC